MSLPNFKKEKILTRNDLKVVNGSDIRKFRDQRCLTQNYMAVQLGIGQSTYQKIEMGEVKLSMERLTQIADIFGEPLDALLKREDINGQNNDIKATQLKELELMQKIIMQQEKRIEELEEKVTRKNNKIEELKLMLLKNERNNN